MDMDLKITFDVTPNVIAVTERICAAIGMRFTDRRPIAGAENFDSGASEYMDMPEPEPASKDAAEAKPEAAVAISVPEPEPESVAEPEVSPKKRSHRKKADATASEEPAPAPVQPEAAPAPAPVQPEAAPAPAEPVPADTQNAPTIDDVRAVGVKLGAAGKQSVIIDYLKTHGCKSLSQLDPGCYAELIEIGKAAL